MLDGIQELRDGLGFMGFFAALFRIIVGDILNDESRAERQGRIGEEWAREDLGRLDPNQFTVLRNMILPAKGGTTEIDAVVFSRFGIFVIEVKTWRGWVFGSERDRTWTVSYSRGRKKKYGNPLLQNYGHAKTLEEITGLPPEAFHPVVVFLGECEFKTPMPDNVIRLKDLEAHILSKREVALSETAVMRAIQTAHRVNDNSSAARKRHAESVRARR